MIGVIKQRKAAEELEEVGTIQFQTKNLPSFSKARRRSRLKSSELQDVYRDDDTLDNPMVFDRYQIKGHRHKKNFSGPFINVGGTENDLRGSRSEEGASDFALMQRKQGQSSRNQD